MDAAAWSLETGKRLGLHTGSPYNRHRWYISMAWLKQSRGDMDTALELMQQAERLFIQGPSPNVQPVEALKAQVWLAQGRLAETLSWARERGLSADDEPSYLRESEHLILAKALIAQHRNTQATDARQSVSTPNATATAELVDPLTRREVEILRLITAGMRNQEISDHLFISLSTVKRHIANAYGKLDVSHRAEAIARANELSLL